MEKRKSVKELIDEMREELRAERKVFEKAKAKENRAKNTEKKQVKAFKLSAKPSFRGKLIKRVRAKIAKRS